MLHTNKLPRAKKKHLKTKILSGTINIVKIEFEIYKYSQNLQNIFTIKTSF